MKGNLRLSLLLLALFSGILPGNVFALEKDPSHKIKGIRTHLPVPNVVAQARTASFVELLDSVYSWSWDTASMAYQSVPFEKRTDILFDVNNNLTGETFQSWNGSAWVNVTRKSYTFLAGGNQPTGTMWESWNGSAWENATLTTISYNLNNYQTSELTQTWNGSAWENFGLTTYTYDLNNNRTSELTQNWVGSAWSNTARHMYVYDVNNDLMSDLYQTWVAGAWANMNQSAYSYDFNNDRTNSVIQIWQSGAWVNYQQYISAYNANHDLTSNLEQRWNGIAWVNDSRYSITYDVNTNITSTTNEDWIGGWENNTKDTFIYDVYQNLTDYLVQDWNDSIWINSFIDHWGYDAGNYVVNQAYTYWDSTGTFAEDGDSLIYYYHLQVGTHDLVKGSGQLNVYPNPVKDQLTVTGHGLTGIREIEMINLEGRKVLVKTVSGNPDKIQLDVSKLADGMYFLKVISETGTSIQKVVKFSE